MTQTLSLFPDEPDQNWPSGLYFDDQFLPPAEQNQLKVNIDERMWSRELKRRVQQYGFRYDYRTQRIDSSMAIGELPPFAMPITDRLESNPSFGKRPDQLIVNEYLPGQGIAAHIDCESCFQERVAILSIGWAYDMEFRHIESSSVFILNLAPGSLVILTGEVRYRWTHQIRPRNHDRGIPRQRRLSMTFRNVILAPRMTRQ
jgi:alkylated DNA repair dioxygenase AlkB